MRGAPGTRPSTAARPRPAPACRSPLRRRPFPTPLLLRTYCCGPIAVALLLRNPGRVDDAEHGPEGVDDPCETPLGTVKRREQDAAAKFGSLCDRCVDVGDDEVHAPVRPHPGQHATRLG